MVLSLVELEVNNLYTGRGKQGFLPLQNCYKARVSLKFSFNVSFFSLSGPSELGFLAPVYK